MKTTLLDSTHKAAFAACAAALVLSFAPGARVYGATTWHVTEDGAGLQTGTNWSNAFCGIQTGIAAASAYDTVLVTNGIYQTGGVTNCPVGWSLTNRIAITTEYVTVRSVNGPGVTTIKGAPDAGGDAYGRGPAAIRCVYMVNHTSLIGFTLTNGATMDVDDDDKDSRGGGVFCPYVSFFSTVISNCVITGNAGRWGGGGCNGQYYNCVIAGNRATYGGGIKGTSSNSHCTRLYNCLLTDNLVSQRGGGAHYVSWLENCTIANNSCGNGGGGVWIGTTMKNCISWGNNSKDILLDSIDFSCGESSSYSNTDRGNTTNDPMFRATGNYRPKWASPCVNSGTNQEWMVGTTDLDGTPRICYGRVDMGAYELRLVGTICTIR